MRIVFLSHGRTVVATDPGAPPPHPISLTELVTWLLWASRAGGKRIAVWDRPIMTYCLSKLGTLRAEHGWHLIGQERTGTPKMLIASSGVLSFVCLVPYDSSLLGHPVNLSHSVSAPPFLST